MQYGICHLSIVPVKISSDDASEMVSQLLYGEHFKVLESQKLWSKIRIAYDNCEGWIYNNQYIPISAEDFQHIEKTGKQQYASDLVSFVNSEKDVLLPIIIGSSVGHVHLLSHSFEGSVVNSKQKKTNVVSTALLYLNAPYLWGGKTPFGIDCSGFTQMVYRINGYRLLRNAAEQATQGESLSFIEESSAGDLAFFDNKDGVIDHVGLIMENNYIIHSSGCVRIDRLDHTGIFNTETRKYTHKLRVIKKII